MHPGQALYSVHAVHAVPKLVLVSQHRLQLLPLRFAELLAGELNVEAQAQVAFGPGLAAGEACGHMGREASREARAKGGGGQLGACVEQRQWRAHFQVLDSGRRYWNGGRGG